MRVLLFLILIFGLNIVANAQKAGLKGKVVNEMGGVLSNTFVMATSKDGKSVGTLTNGFGEFSLPVFGGIYKIEAKFGKSEPYKKYKVKGVLIPFAGEFRFDITLSTTKKFKKSYGNL